MLMMIMSTTMMMMMMMMMMTMMIMVTMTMMVMMIKAVPESTFRLDKKFPHIPGLNFIGQQPSLLLDQSSNQSIDQAINQSINQSSNQSKGYSNRAFNQFPSAFRLTSRYLSYSGLEKKTPQLIGYSCSRD